MFARPLIDAVDSVNNNLINDDEIDVGERGLAVTSTITVVVCCSLMSVGHKRLVAHRQTAQ